jgi:hypothetical protein
MRSVEFVEGVEWFEIEVPCAGNDTDAQGRVLLHPWAGIAHRAGMVARRFGNGYTEEGAPAWWIRGPRIGAKP